MRTPSAGFSGEREDSHRACRGLWKLQIPSLGHSRFSWRTVGSQVDGFAVLSRLSHIAERPLKVSEATRKG